jgi:hypothetical protein
LPFGSMFANSAERRRFGGSSDAVDRFAWDLLQQRIWL